MNTKNCLLWLWLISFVLGGSYIVYGESSPQATQDELYRKAIALKEVGDNNAALDIFQEFTKDTSKDQL